MNGYMNMGGNMNGRYSGNNYSNRGYLVQQYDRPYDFNLYGGNSYGMNNEQGMVQMLHEMANNANPQKREMIHDFLNQLEGMK